MIDSYLREPYQKFFITPILPLLIKSKCTPNLITVAALLLGIAVLPALYLHCPLLAGFFLVASGYCDTLDGSIARAAKSTTPFGAAFDIVSDRAVECAIILGLFFVNPEVRGLHCLLMVCSAFLCVTSFLVVGIFTTNTSEKGFYYSAGMIERSEAFLFFGSMILLPTLFIPLSAIFSLSVALTSCIRIWQFYLVNQ